MAQIKLKLGEEKLVKEATIEDTIRVFESMAKSMNLDGDIAKEAKIMIDLAVSLFGDKGVTEEQIKSLPSEEWKDFSEQVMDIVYTIQGVNTEEDNTETETKK